MRRTKKIVSHEQPQCLSCPLTSPSFLQVRFGCVSHTRRCHCRHTSKTVRCSDGSFDTQNEFKKFTPRVSSHTLRAHSVATWSDHGRRSLLTAPPRFGR